MNKQLIKISVIVIGALVLLVLARLSDEEGSRQARQEEFRGDDRRSDCG